MLKKRKTLVRVSLLILAAYGAALGGKTVFSQLHSYLRYRSEKTVGKALVREVGELKLFAPTTRENLRGFLTRVPEKQGNAAEIYQEVIDSFRSSGKSSKVTALTDEQLATLRQATELTDCFFTEERDGGLSRESLSALRDIVRLLLGMGDDLGRHGRYEEARELYEMVVVMGKQLRWSTSSLEEDFTGLKFSASGIGKLISLATASGDISRLESLLRKRDQNAEEESNLNKEISHLYGCGRGISRVPLAIAYLQGHPDATLRAEAARALAFSLALRQEEIETHKQIALFYRVVSWSSLAGKQHSFWEAREIAAAFASAAESDQEPAVRTEAQRALRLTSNVSPEEVTRWEWVAMRRRALPSSWRTG